jgi:hypothetical protein
MISPIYDTDKEQYDTLIKSQDVQPVNNCGPVWDADNRFSLRDDR